MHLAGGKALVSPDLGGREEEGDPPSPLHTTKHLVRGGGETSQISTAPRGGGELSPGAMAALPTPLQPSGRQRRCMKAAAAVDQLLRGERGGV